MSIRQLRIPLQLFTSLVESSTPGDMVRGGFFESKSLSLVLRPALLSGHTGWRVAHDRSREKKSQQKDAQPAKVAGKIFFPDPGNPQKIFTPLFGEVENRRTLKENHKHKSRQDGKAERCVPQNT